MRKRSDVELPLQRFKDKIDALGPDEPLQLVPGDLPVIAEEVERDPSSVLRVITGERPGSDDLRRDIEDVVGVPIARIKPAGLKTGPRKKTA